MEIAHLLDSATRSITKLVPSFSKLGFPSLGWLRAVDLQKGSIRQSHGSYPSGRPEKAGWSRRGKGYRTKACDESHPPLGRVKGCCGHRHFLSRRSEAIVTHTNPGWIERKALVSLLPGRVTLGSQKGTEIQKKSFVPMTLRASVFP